MPSEGGVGSYGGMCTCPDGKSYRMGDNGNNCERLACENGFAGKCERKVSLEWSGKKVTCNPGIHCASRARRLIPIPLISSLIFHRHLPKAQEVVSQIKWSQNRPGTAQHSIA